jgi:hypothetical protein
MLVERRVERRQGGQVLVRQDERGLTRAPGALDGPAAHDGDWMPSGGLRVGGGDDLEHHPVRVGQEHADAIEAESLQRAVNERLHALPHLHRAHHAHGQRVQFLAHPAAVLDVLKQPRLGQRHGRVLGEGLHDLGLARRERTVGAREEAHDSDRAARDQQR